ncbi:MAG: hypothetical protein KF863_11215 [Rubrivivax sp.]|nr:hypothetical protein [Rubrivivax sp.]
MPDAWQYADPAKLADPEAVRLLLQAAHLAHQTIAHALRSVDPEDFATAPDWPAVLAELRGALAAVGHPAGEGTS